MTASPRPTGRDRFLPMELLALAGGLAVFVGVIVLMATRDFIFAGIALGITFIVANVLLALFALAFKPNAAEVEDIHEQDAEAQAKQAEATESSDTGDTGENGSERPTGH